MRSLALLTDFYVRPPPAADSLKSATFGTAFIRPPHLRLVAEERDKRVHLSAALALAFPTPPTQISSILRLMNVVFLEDLPPRLAARMGVWVRL